MKRGYFQSAPPRRPALRAAAVLVVGVFAAFGLNLGLDFDDQARVADPSVWPTLHESVFQSGQPPSAVPDHALLSASDIERALPVPARTLRLGDSAS